MNTEATPEPQIPEPVEAAPVLIDLGLIAPEDSQADSYARYFRAQSAIQISDINQDGSDQFRVATRPAHVEMMKGLIIDGMKFTTPIRLRTDTWHRQLKIMDGHHRIEAYKALGRTEIPIDQVEIIETMSYVAEKLLPMKANTRHGLGNTYADFYKMLSYIAEEKHARALSALKSNDFELDIPTIALNIGASKKVLEAAYNRYTGPKDAPHPTLSQQLKAKRDEAIIAAYIDEGMSGNAIAKKFNIKSHKTVLKVIEDWEASVAESERRREERLAAEEAEWIERAAKHGYGAHEVERFKSMAHLLEDYGHYMDYDKPTAPPVELPMADTSDRSATRLDPDEVFAAHMEKFEASQAEVSKLMQGWDEPGTNAKAVKISDMDAEQLQGAWKQNQVVKKRADRKHDELLAAAANLGITLEG